MEKLKKLLSFFTNRNNTPKLVGEISERGKNKGYYVKLSGIEHPVFFTEEELLFKKKDILDQHDIVNIAIRYTKKGNNTLKLMTVNDDGFYIKNISEGNISYISYNDPSWFFQVDLASLSANDVFNIAIYSERNRVKSLKATKLSDKSEPSLRIVK